MTREKIMTELFEFSSPTYYKWTKQDKRKIFDLLNYAFTNNELEEFIKTGKINKIEELGNQAQLFELAIRFYKTSRHITNFKIAKNLLYLLERSYEQNNNSVVIEKIAEAIYKSDRELFEKSDSNKNFEIITSMKLALLNLIQKQDIFVLEYICKNRKELEKSSLRKSTTKYINKIDFSYANLAYRA
ncbi:MAG: hypothetical protein AB7S49_10445 [Arcobacter sp.]|jgi:hypothetical protein|uniref:Uncharacterized protein n=1 Tax=Arcobacter defluvii TaxID=873191 RepID=A0AAE7BEL5_9BACT|nr:MULTISPECIES: hypothetical protein [Arcobacter]QKF77118.1 hypothetical protein ADFLV_1084 [Arcobacter defluvii]RXI33590.1 hypothetical protein CP964_06240 [Arcobacter defluvii]BAK73015.1 hypothetical protein ABLL_1140 [Arcobacter sp. L]